uniref:Endo/exonuclease/phosphatase domain-containing protein n=1 Tax=Heligmosomoides polygyrus TaxID=6339 RepID=A0A183G5P4_HELPZ
LQETKGRTETIRKTDHNELLTIGAKVDRKNIGGVGFLVNSTVHHLVDSYEIISPQVAVLRLETKNQGTISIINGYAPTSAATDEEKEEFYELLERTVNDEKSYYKVVVGDFNAVVEAFKLTMDLGKPKWGITFGDRPCSYKQTLSTSPCCLHLTSARFTVLSVRS